MPKSPQEWSSIAVVRTVPHDQSVARVTRRGWLPCFLENEPFETDCTVVPRWTSCDRIVVQRAALQSRYQYGKGSGHVSDDTNDTLWHLAHWGSILQSVTKRYMDTIWTEWTYRCVPVDKSSCSVLNSSQLPSIAHLSDYPPPSSSFRRSRQVTLSGQVRSCQDSSEYSRNHETGPEKAREWPE